MKTGDDLHHHRSIAPESANSALGLGLSAWYVIVMQKVAAFSFALVLIASGCSESSSGVGGAGGTAGAGGMGGTPPPPAAVDQTCRDLCANEAEGFSCFQGPPDMVQACYEQCLRGYQAYVPCGDEWIAIYDCLLDLECADLFGDCDSTQDQLDECVRLENNRIYCEAECPQLDIAECQQDITECLQFAQANRFCVANCAIQDRQECIAQYIVNGTCGAGGAGGPGPLIDNTLWVPSDAGDEILGPPPPGAECELMPIDCPEFPWPEGDCVNFEPTSTCIAAFVPECLDAFTVLAVYTRMPDDRVPLCNWITLEQPSLRAIRAGDRVEVRARHSQLTSPVPGEAHIAFVIGDEQVLDYRVTIPTDFEFPDVVWTAPKDYPAGTPLLFHVDNHGQNEYTLIEVNVL